MNATDISSAFVRYIPPSLSYRAQLNLPEAPNHDEWVAAAGGYLPRPKRRRSRLRRLAMRACLHWSCRANGDGRTRQ